MYAYNLVLHISGNLKVVPCFCLWFLSVSTDRQTDRHTHAHKHTKVESDQGLLAVKRGKHNNYPVNGENIISSIKKQSKTPTLFSKGKNCHNTLNCTSVGSIICGTTGMNVNIEPNNRLLIKY